ncbi:unnamed protein product, partial [Vitis vinifera]
MKRRENPVLSRMETLCSSSPSEKKPEPEASFEILTNLVRVVPAQEKFIKFLEESRYVPGVKLRKKKKICICVELVQHD